MNTKKLYQEKFKKYGVSPKSLLWREKGAAHQRFRQFWAEIDFNNKNVLDIGCGFGEMGKFLIKRYKGVDYTGVDIVPEFINEAKKQLPEGKFLTADFLKDEIHPPAGGYDIVIASGVLNGNMENNMQYRKKAIKRMFKLTEGVLAFNMLGAYPQPKSENLSNVWYADSLEILKYCMSLTRRINFRASYHPKDFTVFMYKAKK